MASSSLTFSNRLLGALCLRGPMSVIKCEMLIITTDVCFGARGDASWTAEEAALNFDMHSLYTNWLQVMLDVQDTGCTPTAVEYTLEPPYGTCCSPTTDQVHPTIFQCSPMSNFSDMAGSVPDMVPMLWGSGGSRGFPGAPVWSAAMVTIADVVRARYVWVHPRTHAHCMSHGRLPDTGHML